MDTITSRTDLFVQFYHFEDGQDAFICGVDGHATIENLEDIQKTYNEDCTPVKGLGDYMYLVSYSAEECGPYGEVECEGFWELTELEFIPCAPGVPVVA